MPNASPPVIAPLVRRHFEDASFYWAQHDASAYSPRLSLSGLARFSDLLDAYRAAQQRAQSHIYQSDASSVEPEFTVISCHSDSC